MKKQPTLARLTMNAARTGYVTLLTWGLATAMYPVITAATTVRDGRVVSTRN